MSFKYSGLYIVCLFIALCSCEQNKSNTNEFLSIKLGRGLPEIEAKASDLVSSVQLIKLETVNKSLIDYFSYPIYVGEDYILYYSAKTVIVFDGTGKFIRKIDQSGEGPKEYTKISSYFYDREKQHIYIVDVDKIQIYTLTGDYVKTLKTGFQAGGIFIKNPNEFYLPQKQVYSQPGRKMLSVVDSTFETISDFMSRNPVSPLEVRQMLFYAGSPYEVDGIIYYKEAFNDTIYQVSDKMIKPVWKVDLQGDAMTTAEGITPWEPALKKQKIPEIAIRETIRFIFFSYYNVDKKFYSIYDKKNNSMIFHNEVLYESDLSKLGVPLDLGNFDIDSFWPNFESKDHMLVQIIKPEDLSDEQLEAIGISGDDNPVLLVAKPKG